MALGPRVTSAIMIGKYTMPGRRRNVQVLLLGAAATLALVVVWRRVELEARVSSPTPAPDGFMMSPSLGTASQGIESTSPANGATVAVGQPFTIGVRAIGTTTIA